MPRFVVLRHVLPPDAARSTHFDLLLEHDGALKTWALADLPISGRAASAEQLSDHRLDYLDYEGPVSGNRGHVTRVDRGTYDVVSLAPGEWRVQLAGTTLRGMLLLAKDRDDSPTWRVEFVADGSTK